MQYYSHTVPAKKSWHDYNESLIERGRVLIDVGFLISTNIEIQKMNQGKVGAPFEYSHSHIHFLAFIKIGFKIAYRTVQGITRGLSDYIRRIEEMHFTHIRRRMLKIRSSVGQLNFEENDKPITLIVDVASGLTNYIKERRLHRGEMGTREKGVYQAAYSCR
ncbi:MAG: transposase [Nitrososphaeraceae archaeon]